MYKKILLVIPLFLSLFFGLAVGWEYYEAEKFAHEKYAFQNAALKGYTLHSKGDIRGAKKAYDEAYALYSKDAVTLEDMGNVYARLGFTQEATNFFYQAYQYDNDKFDALYKAGLGYLSFGEFDKALEVANILIHKDKRSTKYTRLIALALEKQGKINEALGYYAYTIKNKKYHSDPILENLKNAYKNSDINPVEIVFEYEKVEDTKALIKLALEYEKNGFDIKALRSFQKILLENPTHKLALQKVGELLKKHESNHEALEYFSQIEDKDAIIHEHIGALYHRIREYEKALKHYELALSQKTSEELLRAACSVSFYLKDEKRIEKYFSRLQEVNSRMAHDLLYAMEASLGKEHTVVEKLHHITLAYWYSVVNSIKS